MSFAPAGRRTSSVGAFERAGRSERPPRLARHKPKENHMSMTQHQQFAHALQALGVELPADAAEAVDTWAAASVLRSESPEGALRDAASAGTLTAENVGAAITSAAAALVARDKVPEMVSSLDFPLSRRFVQAIQTNADQIVLAMREQFDAAADELAKAATVVPLDADAAAVLNLGPDAATAWHQLAHAAGVLDAIASARTNLARRYAHADRSQLGAALFVAGVETSQDLDRANAAYSGAGPYMTGAPQPQGGAWRRLLDAGFTLHLNTVAEAAEAASAPDGTLKRSGARR
jgi:hypothetical protein